MLVVVYIIERKKNALALQECKPTNGMKTSKLFFTDGYTKHMQLFVTYDFAVILRVREENGLFAVGPHIFMNTK